MKKKILIAFLIAILCFAYCFFSYNNCNGLKAIKSEKELSNIYYGSNSKSDYNFFTKALTMPFSFLLELVGYNTSYTDYYDLKADNWSYSDFNSKEETYKDYSRTNIQVDNVDEADITKTDGDYIYSISNSKVIITNVKNPLDIKIEASIYPINGSIANDLILYKDKLVIISSNVNNYNNTVVGVYDISNKSKPVLAKSYELYEKYYTSRCIDNKLYVISSGSLRMENNKIVRKYKEDKKEYEINFNDIKYLDDIHTNKQTLFSLLDLSDLSKKVNVSSYLIDVNNAYVSENSIYLLDSKYRYDSDFSYSCIFGLKGILGIYDCVDSTSNYYTRIYKFDFLNDGKIKYVGKNNMDGEIINQYSLDEYNNHLRVALHDFNGSRIAIYDDNLELIGESDYVAKGENMYSSRFIGNKVYLVTYKTMDPLFVIDLTNEKSPKVLGELHIPGYSTYLHPYDDGHLIGIGMETKEVVNRDEFGNILSSFSRIVGMKMALFDVSDVNNPIELSKTIIGDSRTTSAILSNPKALLFSKEKNLIAIPVNNYNEDFSVDSYSDSYDSIITNYNNRGYNRVGEGYFVYNINISDGFKLKGIIKHDKKMNDDIVINNYKNSNLLRGLYIDNNLFTVSDRELKVNDLNTLEPINELEIK